MTNYQCLRVLKNEETVTTEIEQFEVPELQPGEVLIAVSYSGMNYKDALATKANTGVVRSYPLTPGIDMAGTIAATNDEHFAVGDEVLATSYGIGVSQNGGFSEMQVVPASWVVKLPKGLTEKQAMTYGTAGFTAALSVDGLVQHGLNAESRVLVTGATGGVGGFALQFLQKIGCKEIIALTRKTDQQDYLAKLGATKVVTPDEFFPEKNRPLNKQTIDYVVDTVGGEQLGKLIPFISYSGSMALCGNAGGIKLTMTVLPFILRGVNLLGIDSVETPMEKRAEIWEKMADEWLVAEGIQVQEIALEQVQATADAILTGKHVGRTLVRPGGLE
ncbi:YhdH/YhfP family quinone oxidoreductase [Enterococcus sp. AZ109]|uniref:YhdH/YhfP family quinone oxidoreductase n=1 Tax=Enterococcus sp. AZ109 TaxID=2774634 RepID=UPI003F28E644